MPARANAVPPLRADLPDRFAAVTEHVRRMVKLANLGSVPISGTPVEFWALHRMETEKWAKIVQSSGAKAE
jgi:hypothetical protein